MEGQAEDECGCKGCRTCLLCERKKGADVSQLPSTQRTETFIYSNNFQQALQYVSDQSGNVTIMAVDFPGVTVIENFISDQLETALVSNIDSCQWKQSQSGRRKQDFGPKVNFKKKKVNAKSFTGLPQYTQCVIDKFKEISQLSDFQTVEQCNLEYVPERGSSIDPHFDDDWLWGERLVTLNLLSDTWLTMTRQSSETAHIQQIEDFDMLSVEEHILSELKQQVKENDKCSCTLNEVIVKIPLRKRSLVILSGDARYKWKHSIQRQDIHARRLCCTFRELSTQFVNDQSSDHEIGKKLLDIALSFKGQVVL